MHPSESASRFQPKLFTQPEILQQIGPARIAKLLDPFRDQISVSALSLLTTLELPQTDFTSLAAFFGDPRLPEPLCNALLALERLASPENSDHLGEAIALYLPCVAIPRTAPPLDRALELWFYSNETLLELAAACKPVSNASLHPSNNPPIHQSTSPSPLGDMVDASACFEQQKSAGLPSVQSSEVLLTKEEGP